ncbi:MAG: hypothetical protein HY052_02520 [Proteobacteria bacterium]|nr:hypothetical protein [Pseudomonadota bacterium]
MKTGPQASSVSFSDRLVSAFLCVLMVIATLGAYLFISFILLGRWSESIFRIVFSEAGIYIIPVSFLAGFFAGPDRLATSLSFLWGAHPVWKREKWRARAIVFFVLALAVYLFVEFNLHDLRYH